MPPKLFPPKDITTRECYSGEASNDPGSPTMRSASPTPPQSPTQASCSSKQPRDILSSSTDSLVSLRRARTPSPTPSPIVLGADLVDVDDLHQYDSKMKQKGWEAQTRKGKLLEMKERRESEREDRLLEMNEERERTYEEDFERDEEKVRDRGGKKGKKRSGGEK